MVCRTAGVLRLSTLRNFAERWVRCAFSPYKGLPDGGCGFAYPPYNGLPDGGCAALTHPTTVCQTAGALRLPALQRFAGWWVRFAYPPNNGLPEDGCGFAYPPYNGLPNGGCASLTHPTTVCRMVGALRLPTLQRFAERWMRFAYPPYNGLPNGGCAALTHPTTVCPMVGAASLTHPTKTKRVGRVSNAHPPWQNSVNPTVRCRDASRGASLLPAYRR